MPLHEEVSRFACTTTLVVCAKLTLDPEWTYHILCMRAMCACKRVLRKIAKLLVVSRPCKPGWLRKQHALHDIVKSMV